MFIRHMISKSDIHTIVVDFEDLCVGSRPSIDNTLRVLQVLWNKKHNETPMLHLGFYSVAVTLTEMNLE